MNISRKATLVCLLALLAGCAGQAPAGTASDEAVSTDAETRSKPDCRYVPTTRSRLGSRNCRS